MRLRTKQSQEEHKHRIQPLCGPKWLATSPPVILSYIGLSCRTQKLDKNLKRLSGRHCRLPWVEPWRQTQVLQR